MTIKTIRMTKIKKQNQKTKTTKQQIATDAIGKRNTFGESVSSATTTQISVKFPQKAGKINHIIPLSTKGLYILLETYMLIHDYCCSIHKARKWKQLSCVLTDVQIMKMWSIYIMELFSC